MSKLTQDHPTFFDDEFIRPFLQDVVHELRMQFAISYVAPYSAVKISTLALVRFAQLTQHLNIKEADTKSLLVHLILSGHIHGRIDERQGTLILSHADSEPCPAQMTEALSAWTNEMKRLTHALAVKQGMTALCANM